VRRVLAAALLVLALAGCAAPRYVYERRSATPAQLDHDLEVCRREGFRPSRLAVWPSNRYDWDVVNRCMERKGYRVRLPEN
jgi:hypothetical protein